MQYPRVGVSYIPWIGTLCLDCRKQLLIGITRILKVGDWPNDGKGFIFTIRLVSNSSY